MRRPSCPRLFEVEAMRDGRLTGAERASFERHLQSCATCSREAHALEALARSAQASMSAPEEQDELHVRRERTRLLAAFDGALVRERPPPRRWAWTVGLVALVLGGVVTWRTPILGSFASSPPAPPASSAATSGSSSAGPAATLGTAAASTDPPPGRSTVIQADSSTRYSKRAEAGRERIVLEHGVLRIQVTHGSRTSDETALLVTLPDGELEDTGTTFTVGVADGRTTHVVVEEGSIVLRLRERPPIVLRAGEAWSVDLRSSAAGTAEASARAAGPASASARSSSVGVPPTATSSAVPNASKDFREAMAAFKAEDHRRAAALFARFLDEHPSDSRAEDAAYLRVMALHRAGDERERKEAARAYLRDHPAGFRRAEVEKLADE